ncbi:MAG: hypothetical protein AAB865_02520, partial [Patescibacteria group bacterium]
RDALVLGITGGLICLLYYFWFALLIPAMIIVMIHRDSLRVVAHRVGFLVLLTVCVAAVAAPFAVPYLASLITFGQENFQATYFFGTDIHLYAPWVGLSIAGLVSLGSIATYVTRKVWTPAQIGSLALITSIVIWHVVQLVILASGEKSVMLSKPFLFLGSIALFLPAAEWVSERISTSHPIASHPRRALIAAIIILAPLLPNGFFLNDARVQAQLEQNLLPKTSGFVIENIKTYIPDYADRLWLTSGLQDINGMIPLTQYLAWNPHFSHPAAHWGSRLENLKRISSLSSAGEVAAAFDAVGVNALLLYKAIDDTGNRYYPFFYEADAWPNGTTSEEIRFSPALFSTEEWEIAHQDNEWMFLTRATSGE